MPSLEYIGLAAGLLTTFAMVPQIVRVYKLKSDRDIRFIYNTMMLIGILVWLVYGIISARISLIIWNILGAILTGWLLYAKFKYGRESTNK